MKVEKIQQQPIALDNLGEQQSAAEMEALAAAEAAEPGVEEPYLDSGSSLRLSAWAADPAEPLLRHQDEGRRGDRR